jgi:ferric-dicitrate binding protein FerR (iron transport regulator)
MTSELSTAQSRLECLRSRKNVAVNDVEIVLTLPIGQVELEPDKELEKVCVAFHQ